LIALGIADAFTDAGARVFTVRSLADALIAIEDEVPSAVILDHALTDGESSQLGECLKERNIPYVLHSGYSAREHDGATDKAVHMPKPASPQHLVTAVEGLSLEIAISSGDKKLYQKALDAIWLAVFPPPGIDNGSRR
jgi:DNA-binding response OmpR family regulator